MAEHKAYVENARFVMGGVRFVTVQVACELSGEPEEALLAATAA